MQKILEHLNSKQFAEMVMQSERTVERWRQDGTGPKFIKAGRRVLYSRKAIDEWLEFHEYESAAEARIAGVR